jgi:hypothetical protein
MSLLGQIGNIGKSNVNNISSSVLDVAINVGKSALNALFPDDYEYYLCSLELLDSNSKQVGFLSFVVMPDQIIENHQPIQSMIKTHNGIVTVYNPTFNPVDISIAGSFGRKFRVVSNFKDPDKSKNGFFDINFGKLMSMDVGVKSGYGLSKILEHMLEKSNKSDDSGMPYFLIFNNYAFNKSYVVDVLGYSYSQNIQNNMIWNYNLSMRAVANKMDFMKGKNKWDNLKTVAANSISNGLTKIINDMIGI